MNQSIQSLTEKLSARPNNLRTHVHRTMDAINAMLPSTVFVVVGDQR
jgi:hypothetical protein